MSGQSGQNCPVIADKNVRSINNKKDKNLNLKNLSSASLFSEEDKDRKLLPESRQLINKAGVATFKEALDAVGILRKKGR
jgi:hypothetical protein